MPHRYNVEAQYFQDPVQSRQLEQRGLHLMSLDLLAVFSSLQLKQAVSEEVTEFAVSSSRVCCRGALYPPVRRGDLDNEGSGPTTPQPFPPSMSQSYRWSVATAAMGDPRNVLSPCKDPWSA